MPWKLIEVTDDGEDTLSDWELLGVKFSLESTARRGNPGNPADSAFGRIRSKLWPHFDRAMDNDKNK